MTGFLSTLMDRNGRDVWNGPRVNRQPLRPFSISIPMSVAFSFCSFISHFVCFFQLSRKNKKVGDEKRGRVAVIVFDDDHNERDAVCVSVCGFVRKEIRNEII